MGLTRAYTGGVFAAVDPFGGIGAAMIQSLKSVSSLLAGMALLMLGSGALATILAVRMGGADVAAWVIGLVMSQYYVGIVLGTGYGHRLISSVGHIRAYAAFGSTMSAATLAHAFTDDPWAWGALRFMVGFCAVGMFMCVESWLSERSTNDNRGRVFALYQSTVYLFQGLAQFMIQLPDDSGFFLYVLMSIIMSMAIVPVAITRVDAPPLPEPGRFNFIKLWQTSPTGMTGALASGLVLGAFYGVGPVFAQAVGLDAGEVASFMGAGILGGLFLQWPLGRLSDGRDRRLIILAVCLAILLTCLALIDKTADNGIGLFTLAVAFGGLSFTLYPLAVSYTNDHLESHDIVPAAGGLVMAYGIGAALGPLGAATAFEFIGANGVFGFCGAVALALATLIFIRMRERAPLAVADQGDFQVSLRTSPVATDTDPIYDEAAEPET